MVERLLCCGDVDSSLTSDARSTQAKQLLRTLNAARSIYEISPHTSLYIPLTIPPSRLPPYVQLARSSQWQTSALLSTAFESITLPSRLRPGGGQRGRLDDLEAGLNVNGSQRIANIQMSVIDPSGPEHDRPAGLKAQDGRMRGSNTDGPLREDQILAGDAQLDMDFFSGESPAMNANTFRAQPKKKHRVFGQVDSVRGHARRGSGGEEDEEEDEAGQTRKRRRLAALPLREKSVRISNLPSPISHLPFAPLVQTVHPSPSQGLPRRPTSLPGCAKRVGRLWAIESVHRG